MRKWLVANSENVALVTFMVIWSALVITLTILGIARAPEFHSIPIIVFFLRR